MDIEKRKQKIRRFFEESRYVRWGLLVFITILFSLTVSPNLVSNNPKYHLGDVAEKDIKTPRDFLIEDKQATEANRKKALENILTVYDHDVVLLSTLTGRVNTAFGKMRAMYQEQRPAPKKEGPAEGAAAPAEKPGEKKSIESLVWEHKPEFEKTLGLVVSSEAYKFLEKEKFSEEIANFVVRILSEILANGVVTNKEILLKELDKGIVLRAVDSKTESVVNSLKQIYGLDQAKTMVRVIGQPLLKDQSHNVRELVVDFAQQLIQPNITLNKSETEERKKKVVEEIKPVLYKIKAGEMILREGERVTEVQLLKLSTLQTDKKKGQIAENSISLAIILLCLVLTSYVVYVNHQPRVPEARNKNLVFMATLFVIFLFLARIFASLADSLTHSLPYAIGGSVFSFGLPAAAAAMTVSLFLGLRVALSFALVQAVCTAFIFQNRLEIFIYFLINSAMASYWIQNCKERKVFIKAGLKLGLLNILLTAAISWYMQNTSGIQLLWNCLFAFMGGFGAGIITAGIAPIIEIVFGYTTDTTLLELANLDRPILRKLMIEAPGTYHHSVIVGSLVEAAASLINANPLLAKVGGYYHDIGKVKKPLYFIENQANGRNRHDKLAPSMSSLILIAHIKNGVEIARENGLGQEIIDTIRQHHGTSLISYFYEKAKQLKGEDAVLVDHYRYPGPKPQTKEAGLVMLGDVVEAACRTLENPTPARIQGLVRNLINKIFADGQLDNCELTLRDLDNIAKSFNTILNGIYHHRIEYFESSAAARGKGKNGGPDRKPARPVQDSARENETKGPGHLKRLGLS